MLNLLKNIFARIWAFWAVLWFITTMLIFYIPMLLTGLFKEPKKSTAFRIASKWWMQSWLPLVGCPLKVKGNEHFAKGKQYVVVCNHNSLLDVPLSSPFIPGANRTIAKKDFMKVPVFNLIYKRGSVLVDRKSEASRRESFTLMKQALASGYHMCIYPEGTRNKSGNPLQPFKDGAFRLAVETGTPVIPAVIFNTNKALPAKKSFYFLPHKLQMHFLAPVEPGTDVDVLKEKVSQIMEAYYVANR